MSIQRFRRKAMPSHEEDVIAVRYVAGRRERRASDVRRFFD